MGAKSPGSARFVQSASRYDPSLDALGDQVAVAGRSNVGKSSLINALLGRRGLARTSSTPGRTQLLNFFAVEGAGVLVDLPGYGYASAPAGVVRAWSAATRDYLARARSLRGVLLLLDVRRNPSPDDLAFVAFVRAAGRPLVVAVTKVDKVSRGQRSGRLAAIAQALQVPPRELVSTSARTGDGRDALWARLLPLWGGGRPRVVAIDGPSGAGKSTVARALADRLGWNYLDTGAMYRAIALKADRAGVALDDDLALAALCRATSLNLGRGPGGAVEVLLDGADVSGAIREHRVSDLASRVSARRPVREALARFQRELGCRAPAVLEGRDIGTVVFPDALVKVYLTASDAERARRRTEELAARGQPVGYEAVLADLRRRDAQDGGREHAPLRTAEGARVVDTTGRGIAETVDELAALVAEALAAERRPRDL